MMQSPEMWGVTLEQIRNLKNHPNFNKNMTMYEVVTEIIKPMTAGTGTGYALLCNRDAPKRATVMVSHAWQENFEQFLITVEQSGVKGPFWICSFCIYQNEDIDAVTIQKQLGYNLSNGPFSTVLRQSDRMLVVITSSCDIYTRLWCVYEMFVAITLNVPVSLVAFNEITTSIGGSDAMYINAVLDSSGTSVLTKSAKCGNKSDEVMIQNEIKKQVGGFDLIDDTVFWVRIKALIDDLPNARQKTWCETMCSRPIGICSASNIVARQNAAIANAIYVWREAQGGRKKNSKRNPNNGANRVGTSTAPLAFMGERTVLPNSGSKDNFGYMELVQERIFSCGSFCN